MSQATGCRGDCARFGLALACWLNPFTHALDARPVVREPRASLIGSVANNGKSQQRIHFQSSWGRAPPTRTQASAQQTARCIPAGSPRPVPSGRAESARTFGESRKGRAAVELHPARWLQSAGARAPGARRQGSAAPGGEGSSRALGPGWDARAGQRLRGPEGGANGVCVRARVRAALVQGRRTVPARDDQPPRHPEWWWLGWRAGCRCRLAAVAWQRHGRLF